MGGDLLLLRGLPSFDTQRRERELDTEEGGFRFGRSARTPARPSHATGSRRTTCLSGRATLHGPFPAAFPSGALAPARRGPTPACSSNSTSPLSRTSGSSPPAPASPTPSGSTSSPGTSASSSP